MRIGNQLRLHETAIATYTGDHVDDLLPSALSLVPFWSPRLAAINPAVLYCESTGCIKCTVRYLMATASLHQ